MTEQTTSSNKSNSSAQTTPFQSIFLSTTRPIPIQTAPDQRSSNIISYTPYTILFQHSTSLHQRIIASEPTSSSSSSSNTNGTNRNNNALNNNKSEDDDTTKIYENAGIQIPKQTQMKNNLGHLFIKEAWVECIRRCHGRVILVQTTAASSSILYSGGRSNAGNGDDGTSSFGKNRGGREEQSMFESNGALIDLYSDPLGWDIDDDNEEEEGKDNSEEHALIEEDEHEDEDEKVPNKQRHAAKLPVFHGQSGNLESILHAIQQCVKHLSSHASSTDSNHHQQQQQPIPIIFDSITPLLIHHGVPKFLLFVTQLKQQATTSFDHHNTRKTNNQKLKSSTIISPIFIPSLLEYIKPPSLHQQMEDYSDAVMTLCNGQLNITKRSANRNRSLGGGGMVYPGFSGGIRLMKEVQYFGYDVSKKELVLFNNNSSNTNRKKTVENEAERKVEEEKEDVGSYYDHKRKNVNDDTMMNERKKSSSILLKHESEEKGKADTDTIGGESGTKKVPRIFIEDNDPEFDDLDEEDPDDDLDI